MRNHPEILEGVILDGVASATFPHYEDYTQDASAAAFRQVFAACAADEACNEAYPDLETTLSGAFEALKNDPQQLTVSLPAQMGGESFDVNVDGALAMEALFSSMFNGSATLPATIAGMAEGDFSLLAPDVGHFFAPGNFSYPMHLAVFCSDDPISPLDEVLDVDVPEMYLARTESDSIKYVIGCAMIDVSRLPDSSDELVRSDLPVLLLSGGLDPATPAENAEEVLTGLPNGDHVVFPGGGHIQGVNACGASLIDAFAMDPTAELDTSCAAAQSPVAFTFVYREPQAVTITGEDGSPVVALEVPAGFWQTGPQSWTNGVFSAFVTPFPAGTPADEALDRIVQANGIADAEYTDGPELLGQTSRELREEVAIQGTSQVVKAVAVETEGGTIRFATNFTGGADEVEAEFDALVETATAP
jgi:pimeloyl-ACP methyl ester carboxylesterase